MKKHEYIGKNLEEATNMAMEDLQDTKDNLYIKEIPIKNGLFNKKTKIEVTTKDELIEYIKSFLLDITKQMGFKSNIEIKKREEIINFILYSDNNAVLIGKNGRNLEALSIITHQMISKEIENPFKFILDVEEYKQKRQNDLERLARKIAREVVLTKTEVKLEAMNSYERRIIHNALTNKKGVYTESVGEQPNRCVVIKPKEE